MKLDSKGIGWLIAGIVICASSFPGTGVADMISTLLIGLTFIAVYVMKQKFKPAGLGWFIAGGILFAFTMDIVIEAAAGLFSRGSDDAGLLSSIMIGGALTFFFLLMFYHRNREVLHDVANGADYSDYDDKDGFEFPYQEKVFKEETVEVVKETAEAADMNAAPADVNAAPDTDDEFIEIEVTDGDGNWIFRDRVKLKKLNWIEITSLYIGVIMGAGFASGRECWQFFGVFGTKGYAGAAASTVCFVLLACMLTYIARSKGTADLGRLICPVESRPAYEFIGWVLAAIYYSMIIAMTAAGGSLLNQQFGIHKAVGGIIIAILCIVTVLGDFERVSKVFRLMIPVLFVVGIITILLTIRADFSQSGPTEGYTPGRMSPNWPVSALVFMAYNTTGMITMAGNSAMNAKDPKNAYAGAIAGTLCLGGLTILLLRALLTDMAFSSELDLPMLGFAGRLSPVLSIIYAVILYGAVYSTGASTYYGFSTKLKDGRYKRWIIIGGALAGFLLGLTGFKKLVEFLYPAQGYIGIVFIILIIMNFCRELGKKQTGGCSNEQ